MIYTVLGVSDITQTHTHTRSNSPRLFLQSHLRTRTLPDDQLPLNVRVNSQPPATPSEHTGHSVPVHHASGSSPSSFQGHGSALGTACTSPPLTSLSSVGPSSLGSNSTAEAATVAAGKGEGAVTDTQQSAVTEACVTGGEGKGDSLDVPVSALSDPTCAGACCVVRGACRRVGW